MITVGGTASDAGTITGSASVCAGTTTTFSNATSGFDDAMNKKQELQDAVKDAAKRAKLKEGKYSVEYIEKPLTPFEEFVTNMSGNTATMGFVRNLSPAISVLQQTKSGQQISKDLFWLNSSAQKPINAVAHCLCVF